MIVEELDADRIAEKADYVISDFGTIVYEAWALGKPVIFPSWIIGDRIQRYLPRTAEAKIFNRGIGLHANSIDEVIDFIDSGAGIDNKVETFLEDYLPARYRGVSSQRVAQVLEELGPDQQEWAQQ